MGDDLWAELVKPNTRLAAALNLVEFPEDLDITPYLTLTTTIAPPMVVAEAVTVDRSRGTVLLSARAADAAAVASLRDPLVERGWVFTESGDRLLDEPGRAEVQAMVSECDSVMLVVGPEWVEQSKPEGPLWKPDDSVRVTLELAMATGTPVVSAMLGNVPVFWYKHAPGELKRIKTSTEVTMYGGATRRGIAKVDRRLTRIRERRALHAAE